MPVASSAAATLRHLGRLRARVDEASRSAARDLLAVLAAVPWWAAEGEAERLPALGGGAPAWETGAVAPPLRAERPAAPKVLAAHGTLVQGRAAEASPAALAEGPRRNPRKPATSTPVPSIASRPGPGGSCPGRPRNRGWLLGVAVFLLDPVARRGPSRPHQRRGPHQR